MEWLAEVIATISSIVFAQVVLFGQPVELIVMWLALPMVLFTVGLGFINLRGLPHAVAVVRGHFVDEKADGALSPFQALATALSGTVGLGNIAGVAIAIATGGPGAAFWMFVIGWFAMSLKFAEVTLGLKYREIGRDGEVRGGPMYTLKNGLAARGWPRVGLVLGGLWAFFGLFGGLPMLQVNQSYQLTTSAFGIADTPTHATLYGLGMAVLVGAVIFGGARRLGRVTAAIVPAMGVVYLAGVAAILLIGWREVPAALGLIVADAFTGEAAAGGALGAFVIGMRRAVFSTEAGIGSAVIAHSQSRTDEPVAEGMVALLEPFIDTVVICSLGALALVVAGTWTEPGAEGIAITAAAFAQIGPVMPWLLTLAVFLFAYSTLCAWGFYGLQAWGYLFGEGPHKVWLFRLFYLGSMPVAAMLSIGAVLDFVDSAFFLMALPNVIALYWFAPELKALVDDYWRRVVKASATPPRG
ncbi:alanine/glycine:cation symporter family protein [Sphingomicrobium astaxanthinifaciens]|uniref:alanine/glycine:cation symporter family protein n=1 Tax=Sphingomicrobium astaxanthinifaciens TaxID=1227949 RepID=UPI001FCB97DD|nr:amino acid carrier protein [Sphingomicrobium astaxanthinifaciens]MCJ7420336.1 alanine:cation symporter family protein [Sphingomicrobium astaxanthinifaciens]